MTAYKLENIGILNAKRVVLGVFRRVSVETKLLIG